MYRQIVNINKFDITIDYSVEGSLKSFKEEVLDHLYHNYKQNGNIPLLFSGGMDSTFILRSLLELGIKPNLFTMSFSKDYDNYDCNLVRRLCNKYGVKNPEFKYIEADSFIEHVQLLFKHFISQGTKIAYPFPHMYIMSYILSLYPDLNFYTGMASEFKVFNKIIKLPYGPYLVQQNNPGRLFDFTSSRTFLSYLNHPKFLPNFKRPIGPNSSDPFYERDQIYMDCYPDIDREIKHFPDDKYLIDKLEEHSTFIKENFPLTHVTEHFYFNVEEYFKQKKERNDS